MRSTCVVPEEELPHRATAKRGKRPSHAAGRVTLEDFFNRIPKEEAGNENLPHQGGTVQQAQQTEASRPSGPSPQQPKRRRAKPETEENTEERRERLLQATLQRIGRMVLPQHAALLNVDVVGCLSVIMTEHYQISRADLPEL